MLDISQLIQQLMQGGGMPQGGAPQMPKPGEMAGANAAPQPPMPGTSGLPDASAGGMGGMMPPNLRQQMIMQMLQGQGGPKPAGPAPQVAPMSMPAGGNPGGMQRPGGSNTQALMQMAMENMKKRQMMGYG